MRIRAAVVGVVFVLASLAYGGPNTVTYQGSVLNSDGSAVADGTYPMRFSIYTVASGGGLAAWQETETGVEVRGGLFSVTLGDGTSFGRLFLDNANLWLEVTIDVNRSGWFDTNETYAPRQKMSAAAWAMDADTLDGRHWTAFGDIMGVLAGTGLSGGGTSGTVTLAANTNYLQRRVTGTAPAGRYISGINSDGTVATGVDQVGTGDITGVAAGTGLSGGGTSGSVTLSANTNYLQRRVTGAAPAGQFLRAINVDGTVVAAVDQIGTGDITAVNAGTGLSGGGTSGSVTLSANTTYLQRRVTGTAPTSQFIRAINTDGTVVTSAAIIGLTAGTGLTGGGTSGTVALAADTTYLQRRVTGMAGSGQYIQAINANGSVAVGWDQVGTGDITGVTAGTGLSGGGTSGTVALSVAFGGDGTSESVARADHLHAWSEATSIPAGFADGIDNDTIYTAGQGLALAGTQFSASFAGSGAASTVSHSDHNHDAAYVNDNAGEVGDGDVPIGGLSANRISGTAWTSANDGSGSGLDADLLDGQDGGFYRSADNINAGTLNPARYSAISDLNAEGYLGNAPNDLAQNNGMLQNNLDADMLDGRHGGGFWMTMGNSGGTSGTDFLGTIDNVALDLRVNGRRGLRIEPHTISPSLIGGHEENYIGAGVYGATIGGGGGGGGAANRVTGFYGTVGGGHNNLARWESTVGGGQGNIASNINATVGGGGGNTASGEGAMVGGGAGNTAGGDDATIGGGWRNTAGALCASVGGGANNIASTGTYITIAGGRESVAVADYATVGGGWLNTASGTSATVAGGFGNTASHRGAAVGGGNSNTASGAYAAVGGGRTNTASGWNATVGGGTGNTASDYHATVAGGSGNTASMEASAVGGGVGNIASGDEATVGGGWFNTASRFGSTVGGGVYNRATTGTYTTVAGGRENTASGVYATVGGGQSNSAGSDHATVGGGYASTAGGYWSTVGGGDSNSATGSGTTVGGGWSNIAGGGLYATVAGGNHNTASGESAVVAGGQNNVASNSYAMVLGGYWNTAAGFFSFAAGRQAKANHHGTFVWGDFNSYDFPSSAQNEFAARATGGVRFVSAIDGAGNPTAGVQLAAGGNSWGVISDRNAKENFAPADPREILERLAAIPVETWNLKSQDPAIRHIGPMAQDFHAAFGVGEDNKHITTSDADGVALAAIQGLHKMVKEKDAEIADLKARLAALEATVATLARRQQAVGR